MVPFHRASPINNMRQSLSKKTTENSVVNPGHQFHQTQQFRQLPSSPNPTNATKESSSPNPTKATKESTAPDPNSTLAKRPDSPRESQSQSQRCLQMNPSPPPTSRGPSLASTPPSRSSSTPSLLPNSDAHKLTGRRQPFVLPLSPHSDSSDSFVSPKPLRYDVSIAFNLGYLAVFVCFWVQWLNFELVSKE